MAANVVATVNKKLEAELRSLGSANSVEMKEARLVLARSWRRVLGVRGGARLASSLRSRKVRAVGGTPSAPGQPPRKQSGTLAKSVRAGVVGDKGRVVVQWFTGALLEAGVNSSLRSSTRNRKAKRQLVIAARPSAFRAIEAVKDQLGPVMATVAGKRLEELG